MYSPKSDYVNLYKLCVYQTMNVIIAQLFHCTYVCSILFEINIVLVDTVGSHLTCLMLSY